MNWTPENIRALREHAGLSQTDFADALGFNRYQTVSEIENGRREVTLTVQRLLDFIAERYGFTSAPTGEEPRSPAEQVGQAATELETAAGRLRKLEKSLRSSA